MSNGRQERSSSESPVRVNFLVNIDVDDLERAVTFYVEAAGLEVARRFGSSAVELVGGPAPIYLLERASGSAAFTGAPAGRDYARHWTPVHLDFVVPDLAAALERAVAAGARREGDVLDQIWGRLALMADPFGHGFCLIEFKGRGYDEIASASGTGTP
jgi:lactoylglutathione lyase